MAKMVDMYLIQTLATSFTLQATIALLLLSCAVQWYFSLPPKPRFPEAELDQRDWHGSLYRAKSKVSPESSRCFLLCVQRSTQHMNTHTLAYTKISFKIRHSFLETLANVSYYQIISSKRSKTYQITSFPFVNPPSGCSTGSILDWARMSIHSHSLSRMI